MNKYKQLKLIVLIRIMPVENIISSISDTLLIDAKIPKKRGRKPKGGKIVKQQINDNLIDPIKQNIILHLKCSISDIINNKVFSSNISYDPNVSESVDGFSFNNELPFEFIKLNDIEINQNSINNNTNNINTNNINTNSINNNNNNNNITINNNENIIEYKNNTKEMDNISSDDISNESDIFKLIWKKLLELEKSLHNNDISDKKSACFWCTCDFDNPPIYIPKYELNNTYHVYGCFCSPECSVAYLMNENIDTTSKFERYYLLNHLYCKIYNYEKNIKPAPNPYYTLDKYYGNLTIQEWRKLLKNERILLIVDKPLTRQLPEIHQDNYDYITNYNSTTKNENKYKLTRKGVKQNKTDCLNEQFGFK